MFPAASQRRFAGPCIEFAPLKKTSSSERFTPAGWDA
jgi:hypothetical protein